MKNVSIIENVILIQTKVGTIRLIKLILNLFKENIVN